jgi:tetratricopeptide (TPR) repeat protein
MRVDSFGIRDGAELANPLLAPLRPEVPSLVPGRTYLIETVIRTVGMGHHFTQGTTDSNEIWLSAQATSGGRTLGRSGALDSTGNVDPWSHFVNSYVLDREGNRIDRRNAQDIFVPLYNHQIPPGAADVVHLQFQVPANARDSIEIDVQLLYRKFDSTYMKFVYGDDFVNDLPIMTLAEDRIVFPIEGSPKAIETETSEIPEWQRWNDYGIGLLRKGNKSRGELRQAEEAFHRVEFLGRPEGPINLARVYLAQGTVRDAAIDTLSRAAEFQPPAPSWQVAWFSGLVNKQNGFLDEAIASFRSIIELDDAETRAREFDFSQDYRVLNELGQTLFERAKQERGATREESRKEFLGQAADLFQKTLELDPENVAAHYNLNLIYQQLGLDDPAENHFNQYLKYKPDDNARDAAIAAHRASHPAADHAANAVVFYDLQRPGTLD